MHNDLLPIAHDALADDDVEDRELFEVYADIHGLNGTRLGSKQFGLRAFFLRVTLAICLIGLLTSGLMSWEMLLSGVCLLPFWTTSIGVLLLPVVIGVIVFQLAVASDAQMRRFVFNAGVQTIRKMLFWIALAAVILSIQWCSLNFWLV